MKAWLKESSFLGFNIGCWWIFTMVLIIATLGVLLALTPTFHNWWIKAFRSSNEYVTTKQTVLLQYVQDYYKTDAKIAELSTNPDNAALVMSLKGQQISTVNMIRQQSNLLQPDQIPPEVARFLATH